MNSDYRYDCSDYTIFRICKVLLTMMYADENAELNSTGDVINRGNASHVFWYPRLNVVYNSH